MNAGVAVPAITKKIMVWSSRCISFAARTPQRPRW